MNRGTVSRDPSFLHSLNALKEPQSTLNASSAVEKLHSLVNDPDSFLKNVKVPKVSHVQFQLDCVTFQIGNISKDNGLNLVIWSVLGYLPFSAVSMQRRSMLISILYASQGLRSARFGVDPTQQIIVKGKLDLSDAGSPEYFFVPMMPFLQEALPFIKLIGECL